MPPTILVLFSLSLSMGIGKKDKKYIKKGVLVLFVARINWSERPDYKKKVYVGKKIVVFLSWPGYPSYKKNNWKKYISWKKRENVKKKVNPEISHGVRKLSRTARLLKKKCKGKTPIIVHNNEFHCSFLFESKRKLNRTSRLLKISGGKMYRWQKKEEKNMLK